MKTVIRLVVLFVFMIGAARALDYNLNIKIVNTRPITGQVHDFNATLDKFDFNDVLFVERGSGAPLVCRLQSLNPQDQAYALSTWNESGALSQVVTVPGLGKIFLFTHSVYAYSADAFKNTLFYRSGAAYLVTDIGYKPGYFEQTSIGLDPKKVPEENRRLLERLARRCDKIDILTDPDGTGTISTPPTRK